MDEKDNAHILQSYSQEQEIYKVYANGMKQLIESLLEHEKIVVHSVTSRCKTKDSLERKISRPEKNYSNLTDITDLAAVRVTTYFSNDVDKVAALIEREFCIDRKLSVDKRIMDKPDRFGYQSLHFISSLQQSRATLAEYRNFSSLKFEIQIRSILQHAWAEIEHDLGYKTPISIPQEVRRRFARVASLLELADEEFVQIRDTLQKYETQLPQRIDTDPSSVDLNIISLKALYHVDSCTKRLDETVALASNSKLLLTQDAMISDSDLKRLKILEITSIAQLEQLAESTQPLVEKIAKYWLGTTGKIFPRGIGIFYLAFGLAWQSKVDEKINAVVSTCSKDLTEIEKIKIKLLEFKMGVN